MTKKDVKLKLALTIRNAVLTGKEKQLKVENIIQIMEEHKVNRTQLKATIRNGNANFRLNEDDFYAPGFKYLESKTYAAIEKICEWIDTNLPKPTKK